MYERGGERHGERRDADLFRQQGVLFVRLGPAPLLGLTAQAGEVKAQQIYFTREMQNHHGGLVLVDGYLYGFHNSILTCWSSRPATDVARPQRRQGQLIYADGNLYLQSEDNVVGLAERRRRIQGEGRFRTADQIPERAHPVVMAGGLHPDQGTLAVHNIKAR
jgi:hypothetical protein